MLAGSRLFALLAQVSERLADTGQGYLYFIRGAEPVLTPAYYAALQERLK